MKYGISYLNEKRLNISELTILCIYCGDKAYLFHYIHNKRKIIFTTRELPEQEPHWFYNWKFFLGIEIY